LYIHNTYLSLVLFWLRPSAVAHGGLPLEPALHPSSYLLLACCCSWLAGSRPRGHTFVTAATRLSPRHPPWFLTAPVGKGHGVWRVALQQLARSSRHRRGRGRADGALWNRAFSGKWCGDDERRARAGHWYVSWALGSGESETALPVALSVKTALFCLLPASYANGATALLGTHLEELQCKSLSPAKFPCVEQRWFLQLLRIKSPCVERAFVWCNHIILSQKS